MKTKIITKKEIKKIVTSSSNPYEFKNEIDLKIAVARNTYKIENSKNGFYCSIKKIVEEIYNNMDYINNNSDQFIHDNF